MRADSSGPGPYRKRKMRVLAVTGTILAVIVAIGGIRYVVEDNPAGPLMLMIAAACGAVLAFFVPLAKRRGRM